MVLGVNGLSWFASSGQNLHQRINLGRQIFLGVQCSSFSINWDKDSPVLQVNNAICARNTVETAIRYKDDRRIDIKLFAAADCTVAVRLQIRKRRAVPQKPCLPSPVDNMAFLFRIPFAIVTIHERAQPHRLCKPFPPSDEQNLESVRRVHPSNSQRHSKMEKQHVDGNIGEWLTSKIAKVIDK